MSQTLIPEPAAGTTAEADVVRWRRQGLRRNLTQSAIWVVLLLLTVVSTLISPVFMTTRNISTLLKQAASLGIVSVGQTLAILTGGIDLSVASVMALLSGESARTALRCIGGGMVGPVPASVILWAVIVVIFVIRMRRTTFGRRIYAV